jgi:acyl carrier protein
MSSPLQQRSSSAPSSASQSPGATGRPAATDADDVVERLRSHVAALSEGKLTAGEVDPEGHLFDYGYLSSLTAVMFLANIEEQFGVEIEDLELVEELTTLSAVAARIRELR